MPDSTAITSIPSHDPSMFVHTADLHLAPRSASIAKRDRETGRLVRDLDMDGAFVRAVDDALRQSPLPSAFVVAGDVFDTWRGSIDAMICVISQVRRLRAAGIEVVGIAGNHDTPNKQTSTCMFELLMNSFSQDDGVTLAYDRVMRRVVGDIEFVLLPHRVCLEGGFSEADLRPSGDVPKSVLVVHGVAAGDPSLRQMDEAKEIPVASWVMNMDWDYIAFGHYHKPGWIRNYEGKASYCGSLENTVISGPDVCMERGPVYIDLSVEGEGRRTMHPLPVRRIVTLPDVVLPDDSPSPEEVDELVAQAISEGDTSDAIVRLTVRNIARSTYQALPRRSFSTLDPSALLVRVDWEYAAPAPAVTVMIDEETGREIVIEEVADGGTGEFRGKEELLPLEKEAEGAVDTLVANGTIPEAKRDAVLDLVRESLS